MILYDMIGNAYCTCKSQLSVLHRTKQKINDSQKQLKKRKWRSTKKYEYNKHIALRKEAGSPPVSLWSRRHNSRWLWTTGSNHHTPFTTLDNICDDSHAQLTAAVDWPSRTGRHINIWTNCSQKTRISPQGGSECSDRSSGANFYIVYSVQ